ncbi:prolyl-tRNA synthetase associated domain-containing protein [uncultured Mobiluncus sp.]|uniref:prolyl-tRNA synthetase associated domain-containing protein n=1 Tax=uncultured Mobiluncus sp. TaxID=293425 RepID=UPI0025FD4793|nr:prolyl-tRNA synthetase associated domain-containing protein [uncultured Mobiluncus sp.]
MERSKILETLQEQGVEYKLVEHPPATTIELADEYIEGHEGVRTKSLFLTNRKKTRTYLLITDEFKQIDLKGFADTVGESRLSFGSGELLAQTLGLEPGVVSPLGMIDPGHRSVALYLDKAMMQEEIFTFHPGDNRATLFLGTQDFLRLYDELGIEYHLVEV